MSLKKSTCILGAIIMMSVPMSAGAQNLVPKEIKNPATGQISYTIPLPSNWRVSNNPNSEYFVTGPNGLKIHNTFSNKYFYGNTMNGIAPGNDRQYLAPMSAEQYFQQIVQPNLQSQGYKFLKSYPLPEYVTLSEKFSAGILNTGNRRSFQAIGSDWQTGAGETSMVATVVTYTQGQAGTLWEAQLTQMEAPNSQFNQAKKTVRYGVANSVVGRQNLDTLNRNLAQANHEIKRKEADFLRREAIRHKGVMDGIARAGATSNAIAQAGNDALDSSMSSYQRIQAMKDKGQSSSVRSIHGETIISDPNSGRRYTAPTGSNNYWVNSNGELIRNDNSNYNPNTDNSVNQYDWTLYDPED